MPSLVYFRLHYLNKIWLFGLVCLIVLLVNFIYTKHKERVFEADRRKKQSERMQVLVDKKKKDRKSVINNNAI